MKIEKTQQKRKVRSLWWHLKQWKTPYIVFLLFILAGITVVFLPSQLTLGDRIVMALMFATCPTIFIFVFIITTYQERAMVKERMEEDPGFADEYYGDD